MHIKLLTCLPFLQLVLLYDLLDKYALRSISSYEEVNPGSKFPGYYYYEILKYLGPNDYDRFGVVIPVSKVI